MSRRALHHHLLESASRNPTQLAYSSGTTNVTYEAVALDAARFAAGLRARGVSRGDRVVLVIDGRAEYLIAFYGALLAGAAPVPICPDTRTEILAHPLANSGARAVVLEGKNAALLSGLAERLPELRSVIILGNHPPLLNMGHFELSLFEACLTEAPLTDAGAGDEDLAAIIYTSGTTGKPKGVMLAHRSLVANTRSIVEYLGLQATDSVGMVLPFYYSYGNSVLHTHIAAGATIVQVGNVVFPKVILDTLAQQRCTGFSGVPATFARLATSTLLESTDLSALRYITQAGAAMTAELATQLRQKLPQTKLFVMYGQTEASARLAYLHPDDLPRKPGSVGKAIPGMTLRVLDAAGKECAANVQGELVAQGDSLMVGYWDDAEATAKTLRFDGLHTGDLAYKDDEGFIFLVGRESDMIKAGAHRIAPQEIEAAVASHPAVSECAAVGKPDEILGEAIVVFVVKEENLDIDVDDKTLLRWCLERLPRFKMPSEIRFTNALPKTTSGKLTRSALKKALSEEAAAKIS